MWSSVPRTAPIISSELSTDQNAIVDDALGGRAYYLARAELEIPLGAGVRELGLRPSIYVDVGANFGLRDPAGDSTSARPVRSRRTHAPTTAGVITLVPPTVTARPARR